MRAALISIAGQPRDGEGRAPLAVAGKTLARRQLDFALAAECERVIALGDGGSGEAIALRHAAEGAGATFQTIGDSRGLLGAVRTADQLLILAPGLLPEAVEVLEALRGSGAVLVLPADAGIAAGFERIDLDRAWAGAAVLPAALVERLSELPPDIDPASALMRVALQARVPEHRLPQILLTDALWSMPRDGVDLIVSESAWLRRHSRLLRALPGPFEELAWGCAIKLLADQRSVALLLGAVAMVLVGAAVAAWLGIAALGFALIPLAVLGIACAAELARLREAPFGKAPLRLTAALSGLVDATMVVCALFAIDGGWLHRLFPPLVLLGALHLPGGQGLAVVVRNRALLAAVLAFATAFGAAEPVLMLVGLVLLALTAARIGAKRG